MEDSLAGKEKGYFHFNVDKFGEQMAKREQATVNGVVYPTISKQSNNSLRTGKVWTIKR